MVDIRAEPILAIRAVRNRIVLDRGVIPSARSVMSPLFQNTHIVYEYGQHYEADCIVCTLRKKSAPRRICACGFYGLKPGLDALGILVNYLPKGAFDRFDCITIVAVLFYGKVIEHELGYRAQKMYICSAGEHEEYIRTPEERQAFDYLEGRFYPRKELYRYL